MKSLKLIFLILLFSLSLSACVLTKIVTVPMRLGGAVISIVPAMGNQVDDAIDVIADKIDKVPI